MHGEPLRWLTSCTPRPVSTAQKLRLPLFEEQVTMALPGPGPPGPPGRKPWPPPLPRKKSARQPRSTQIPCRLNPHVCPWIQGEPLRWFVICTPRLVSTRQRWRRPSSEAQVTCRPLLAVIPLCACAGNAPMARACRPSNKTIQVSFFIRYSLKAIRFRGQTAVQPSSGNHIAQRLHGLKYFRPPPRHGR
jgi:hypothetical protein